MLNYILASVGSAAGRIPRFWIPGFIANHPGQSFPEI